MLKRCLILLCIFLSACASTDHIFSNYMAADMSKVSIGMNKQQVIQAIGTPMSISAKGGMEYLGYRLSDTYNEAVIGITHRYYVRLVNGRVDSYGRVGDFDSTKSPELNIKLDHP